MNPISLSKLYDRLTPVERVPLIAAASDRGDTIDEDRLTRSAPRMLLSVPNYQRLSERWLLLSLFHMVEQLNHAATFWRYLGAAVQFDAFLAGLEDKAKAQRLLKIHRMIGYRLCVEADAWELVCSDRHMSPDSLVRDLPSTAMLRNTEKVARKTLWTPEEAAAYLLQIGGEELELATVEGAAKIMRDFLDKPARLSDGY